VSELDIPCSQTLSFSGKDKVVFTGGSTGGVTTTTGGGGGGAII
jgi:hypothetical protein